MLEISPTKHRVAYVQYTSSARVEFSYIDDAVTLANAISNVEYWTGATYTGNALQYAYNEVVSIDQREGVRQIILLINDGTSSDEVSQIGTNLRNAGIQLYALGYKDAVHEELMKITNDEDRIFIGQNAIDLLTFRPKLTEEMCNVYSRSLVLDQ